MRLKSLFLSGVAAEFQDIEHYSIQKELLAFNQREIAKKDLCFLVKHSRLPGTFVIAILFFLIFEGNFFILN